jgi:hypothetical protein
MKIKISFDFNYESYDRIVDESEVDMLEYSDIWVYRFSDGDFDFEVTGNKDRYGDITDEDADVSVSLSFSEHIIECVTPTIDFLN